MKNISIEEKRKGGKVSVKVRLATVGKRKQRSYRIVAIESRNPRNGRYLEKLGWYNPRTKEIEIDEEAIKRWQEKGAILSSRVKALLKRWRESKTEEVSDAEGTDNLHSQVSGGST